MIEEQLKELFPEYEIDILPNKKESFYHVSIIHDKEYIVASFNYSNTGKITRVKLNVVSKEKKAHILFKIWQLGDLKI